MAVKFFSPPNIVDPFAVGVSLPQGRLTVTSGLPILTATVTGSANIYYTPFVGNKIPIWNGTNFEMKIFSELTNILANSSVGNAGPAAGAAAKVYYLVVWSNNGILTLTRSPAWTSDTVPGTGAASAEVSTVQGIRVNAVSITNGPAAGYGTIVGVMRTDAGAATITWQFGATASGATAGWFGFRNTYNRRQVINSLSESNAASHTYSSATVQAYNALATMRFSVVRDFTEDDDFEFIGYTRMGILGVANAFGVIGIGLDVTNAISSSTAICFCTTIAQPQNETTYVDFRGAGIGFHFFSLNEQGDGANNTTFYHSPYVSFTFKGMM